MSEHAAMLPPGISRRLRRQQLVTFLIVALFCVLTAYWQNTQTAGLREQCRTIRDGNASVNSFLDQVIQNTKTSTTLTPEEKAQRIAGYSQFHLPVPRCGGIVP